MAAALLSGCAAPNPGAAAASTGQSRQQDVSIPIRNSDGSAWTLAGRICRPATDAPARLVVIAHGAPAIADKRPTMELRSCDEESSLWFLDRGFVVVHSLRRGYGATGGPYWEATRPCTVETYAKSAKESARDVAATIDYAMTLPFVRPDGAVVVGQSAGGWAALGLDSEPHPKVIAFVSMAGGRGGHSQNNEPNTNCRPDNLEAAAGVLGKTASTPMLWVFTQNDSFFAPPIATAMHAAFTGAGGTADLRLLGPFRRDGHNLFFGPGGAGIWGPLMEAYLRTRGAL